MRGRKWAGRDESELGSVNSSPGKPPWKALWVLALGLAMIVLDSSIVNVSIPAIINAIHIDMTTAQWVTALYSVILAALLLPAGRLGDMIGRKRIFQVGTVIFILGSSLAAAAHSGSWLLTARIIQGIGGSMVMPSTLSSVSASFRGVYRARAFGVWGAVMSGAAALGPFLGGLFTTTIGWRWIFLVNLPLGLVILVSSLSLVPETRSVSNQGYRPVSVWNDWAGILLSALGSALVVFALIEGQTYGWLRPAQKLVLGPLVWPASAPLSVVPVSFVLGLVLLAGFILVELARKRGGHIVILDLSLFSIATFRWGNLTAAIISAGQFSLIFILPLYLINACGLSALEAGSLLGIMALGALLSGGLARQVSARLGAGGTVQLGLVMEILGVVGSALVMRDTVPVWALLITLVIYGTGLGFASAQLTSLVLSGVPLDQSGQASATQSTIRQWGTALGAAISGSSLSAALGLVMPAQLHSIPGLSSPTVEGLTQALRSSAGNLIGVLKSQGMRGRLGVLGPQVAQVMTRGFTQGARLSLMVAAALLLIGLMTSIKVRQAARLVGSDQ